ncbi:hypothetical protein TrRE_jg3055 [Triparma retinervis]|uniref:Vesicle transport protein n=1 Tax=Triparma retinervis TaxID=2557542 RepID=A0A9W7KT42_9STRA|nr:hypothetical protein TrRE_jg3055 [Triparma retinervis]
MMLVCSVFPSLSYTQRLYGCLGCAVLGFLLSFGSFFRFSQLLKGNPAPFALCFTLGSMVALAGTCFLSGPRSQAGKMFKKTRCVATTMYLLSMSGTLLVAFALPATVPARGALVLACVALQYVAIVWYTLSYIPFARQWAKSCCTAICCGDEMC